MTDRARQAVVLAGLAVVLFAGVWMIPFQEPDEGRYGDIAASMVRTGDWLTPRLNGIRYYEKPPLYFWLGAVSVSILGPTEAAVRLPSALACFATALLLMNWARRAGGSAAGLLAGAMIGTAPLFCIFAHMAMVDLAMTFLTTLALYAAWRGVVESEEISRKWVATFWIACALAMLTKGPVGVVLPVVSAVGFLALTRSRSRMVELLRPDGLLVFAAIAAPWFAAMEMVNPGYADEFFVGQVFGRAVAGDVFDRNAPAWFYVPQLVFYLLPWTLLLPGAARALRIRRFGELSGEEKLLLFLACSILGPLVILSSAQSKIGYYLLPLAPPLALAAALYSAKAWCGDAMTADDRGRRRRTVILAAIGFICIAAAGAIIGLAREDAASLNARFGRKSVSPERFQKGRVFIEDLQRQAPWVAGTAAATGLIVWGAAFLLSRRRGLDALLTAALALAFLEVAAMGIALRLSSLRTAEELANRLRDRAGPGEPIVLLEEYMTSLPFRLGRTVTIMDATFPMFGHEVHDLEAEGLSLQERQDRQDRLAPFLAKHPSTLIVCRSEEGEVRARRAGSGSWESLDRVGKYSILRHRRTAD